MTETQRQLLADRAWLIEVYHRALKQFTGIERGQFRLERSQRNHIGLALRAYVRLEYHRWRTRLSIFNSKLDIIRAAVRLLLGSSQVWPSLNCVTSTSINLQDHDAEKGEASMRVLIVEDEPKMAMFLRQGLEEQRYAVDIAADGEEGLQWAINFPYDLIILDVMLPQIDGDGIMPKVARSTRSLPPSGCSLPVTRLMIA